MEESPVLVSNVEFDEVKRGYDPEQVDAYLEEVGKAVGVLKSMLREAVERAESADARVAETLRAKASAESMLNEVQTGLASLEQAREVAERERDAALAKLATAPEDQESEALKKMLMLAQRTADSAVEEAQASAKNIVADARTKAAEVVADAETRAERLLIEAQKVADELIKEKTGALVLQVRELERRRDDLFADVQSLVDHLKDHRQRLHDAVLHMGALIDGPIALRPDGLPELRTLAGESTVADRVAELESAAAPAGAPAPAPAPAPVVPAAPPVSEASVPPAPALQAPVDAAIATTPPVVEIVERAPSAPPAAPSSSPSASATPGPAAAPMPAAPTAAAPTSAAPTAAAPRAGAGPSMIAGATAGPSATAPTPIVTASAPEVTMGSVAVADRPQPTRGSERTETARVADLVEAPRSSDAALDPEPVSVVSLFDQGDPEPPQLGTDPEADEAMRRFLEEDFESKAPTKGIFRRK